MSDDDDFLPAPSIELTSLPGSAPMFEVVPGTWLNPVYVASIQVVHDEPKRNRTAYWVEIAVGDDVIWLQADHYSDAVLVASQVAAGVNEANALPEV